jgi:hypothetical protein
LTGRRRASILGRPLSRIIRKGVTLETRLPARPVVGPVLATVLAALTVGCRDGTGPGVRRVVLETAAGDAQFGSPGSEAADPLHVFVLDATTREPVDRVEIQWRVVAGAGAGATPARSTSNRAGLAASRVRFGPDTGVVRVEATADGMSGAPATFQVSAVPTPVIESIEPAIAVAGGTITVTGRHFSNVPAELGLLVGGRAGRITAATATGVTAEVPTCVPSRTLDVRVARGAVRSAPRPHAITAGPLAPLALARGEVRTLDAPAAFACLAFPPEPGATYLLVPQDARMDAGLGMRFELATLTGGEAQTLTVDRPGARTDHASAWEFLLRARERALFGDAPVAPTDATLAAVTPAVGDRRQFNVLNRENRTDRVTAEVRAITEHAILYVDLEAPSGGFTTAELVSFGRLFDDPIHPTTVAAFGQPSDIDGNGRIIVLFTPRVNALTLRNESSFIAGYFYGCDLVEVRRCADSNRAEIFYSMVPDPEGRFSAPRSKQTVLRTVPGVLAHEFQHMIHFGARGRLDELWLSEGLAHAAEDLVGDVLAARGDAVGADDFRLPNRRRAADYLSRPASVSLVQNDPPGSLEQRGGVWLLVRYLQDHHGGQELLRRLTRAGRLGARNVEAETGRAWHDVLAGFGVALWATGAPELTGVALPARWRFLTLDPRREVLRNGAFPLQPLVVPYIDAFDARELPAGAFDHVLLRAAPGTLPPPFSLSFTGRNGGAFAPWAAPRLTVLRVR